MATGSSEVALIVSQLVSNARNLDVRMNDGSNALLDRTSWDGQDSVRVQATDGRCFVIKVEQV